MGFGHTAPFAGTTSRCSAEARTKLFATAGERPAVGSLPSRTRGFRSNSTAGDVLCCSERAQDVLAGELGHVGTGPSPVGEGGEQPRIPRHVLQALGHGLRPHVVTPDADMVDAGDLTYVLDVLHDLGQFGDRRR